MPFSLQLGALPMQLNYVDGGWAKSTKRRLALLICVHFSILSVITMLVVCSYDQIKLTTYYLYEYGLLSETVNHF
jgi:hypothetical protein